MRRTRRRLGEACEPWRARPSTTATTTPSTTSRCRRRPRWLSGARRHAVLSHAHPFLHNDKSIFMRLVRPVTCTTCTARQLPPPPSSPTLFLGTPLQVRGDPHLGGTNLSGPNEDRAPRARVPSGHLILTQSSRRTFQGLVPNGASVVQDARVPSQAPNLSAATNLGNPETASYSAFRELPALRAALEPHALVGP